jgi:hypothetical protein
LNRPIRLGAEAEVEAIEAARWYETRRPGLGYDFLAALDETPERIRSNPRSTSLTTEAYHRDPRLLSKNLRLDRSLDRASDRPRIREDVLELDAIWIGEEDRVVARRIPIVLGRGIEDHDL